VQKKLPIIIAVVLVIIIGIFLVINNADSSSSGGGRSSGSGGGESSSSNPFEGTFESGPADLGTLGMSLDALGPFQATFTITFNGKTDWVYQVVTRYDGEQVEYSLHIEGLDPALNPGDVRLVNSGGINRMVGPGTDGACVQFPDSFETVALFITPIDLIEPEDFSDEWLEAGLESVAGRDSETFSVAQSSFLGWDDVTVTYAVDSETGAILSFTFEARGADPLFDTGDGRISGEFVVTEIGPQEIDAVEGCEVGFPLPDDATDLVMFPGMIAFKTMLGPVKLDKFFNQRLVPLGWVWQEPAISDERQGLLTYTSETQEMNILIKPVNPDDFGEGYEVEIFIEDISGE
jgi:hypothetical protein